MRLPHPLLLLLAVVLVAAGLTWIVPAGQFERRDDPATGRRVAIAGTYHRVPAAPVGPFGAAVAVARGFVAAADVIAVVLFVGGAWVVVDKVGALSAVITRLVSALGGRGYWAIPIVSLFFAAMGALENMQEEIIPLIPALLALGRAIRVDPVGVVAMSAGAAMIGSAFGPTNPFQAGIALKIAQLDPLTAGRLRVVLFVAALVLWIAWTLYSQTGAGARGFSRADDAIGARGFSRAEDDVTGTRSFSRADDLSTSSAPKTTRPILVVTIALVPMALYVYGVMRLDWGFNELAAVFLVGGLTAGLAAGLTAGETINAYLEGMQAILPAAFLIGVARSISLVLEDGRVVDTILQACATALGRMPPIAAAYLMIPFQALLHIPVPSVSGQAVLAMPIMVPLTDLLHLPRLSAVLAYELGAGLCELITPTNGALMAVLLAAGVPYGRWIRFALVGAGLALLVGIVGIAVVVATM